MHTSITDCAASSLHADEAFVADLAKHLDLEFFAGHGNVRDHAFTSKLSIEAAGRELRYRWFAALAEEQRLDAIATAHTLDDQAETVLLKFLRGAGSKGLAGIYPVVELAGAKAPSAMDVPDGTAKGAPLQSRTPHSKMIRPLLSVSRQEVEDYLTSLDQTWREDESNLDRRFLRNRVRHELLPLLEREFNPNIRQALSDAAEIARGDEQFWQQQVERELGTRLSKEAPAANSASPPNATASADQLNLNGFAQLPLALQRRALKAFAERHQLALDFEHIERLRCCALGELAKTELPGGTVAERSGRALSLRQPSLSPEQTSYQYVLLVPGEIHIAELKLTLRVEPVPAEFAQELTPGELLSLDLVGPELTVRNWLPGDRFRPAHSASTEKLKRLFAEKHIPSADRPAWPVVLSGQEIVWVRGFPAAHSYQWRGKGSAVRIEVISG